jgi:hypothetical protein
MRDLIVKIGMFIIAVWTLFWIGVMFVLDTGLDYIERLWEKIKQKKRT